MKSWSRKIGVDLCEKRLGKTTKRNRKVREIALRIIEENLRENYDFMCILKIVNIIGIIVHTSCACSNRVIVYRVIMPLPKSINKNCRTSVPDMKNLSSSWWSGICKRFTKQRGLFSMLLDASKNLKVGLCCWIYHTIWTQDLEKLSWSWPRSLLPED